MLISIGPIQLLLALVALLVTAIAFWKHRTAGGWLAAITVCLATAMCLTPPDPLSMILLGALLMAAFTCGAFFSQRFVRGALAEYDK